MKTKSVEYQYLVALLIEAFKELKAENDKLKGTITALTDRQSAIEDMLLALSIDLPKDKLAKLGMAR